MKKNHTITRTLKFKNPTRPHTHTLHWKYKTFVISIPRCSTFPIFFEKPSLPYMHFTTYPCPYTQSLSLVLSYPVTLGLGISPSAGLLWFQAQFRVSKWHASCLGPGLLVRHRFLVFGIWKVIGLFDQTIFPDPFVLWTLLLALLWVASLNFSHIRNSYKSMSLTSTHSMQESITHTTWHWGARSLEDFALRGHSHQRIYCARVAAPKFYI